jgi:hypothetical protein
MPLSRSRTLRKPFQLLELFQPLEPFIRRNIQRFPEDFMFQLNESETDKLVSQTVIPHKKYFGGSRPYAFTEQGITMLSGVLNVEGG